MTIMMMWSLVLLELPLLSKRTLKSKYLKIYYVEAFLKTFLHFFIFVNFGKTMLERENCTRLELKQS